MAFCCLICRIFGISSCLPLGSLDKLAMVGKLNVIILGIISFKEAVIFKQKQ